MEEDEVERFVVERMDLVGGIGEVYGGPREEETLSCSLLAAKRRRRRENERERVCGVFI